MFTGSVKFYTGYSNANLINFNISHCPICLVANLFIPNNQDYVFPVGKTVTTVNLS